MKRCRRKSLSQAVTFIVALVVIVRRSNLAPSWFEQLHEVTPQSREAGLGSIDASPDDNAAEKRTSTTETGGAHKALASAILFAFWTLARFNWLR